MPYKDKDKEREHKREYRKIRLADEKFKQEEKERLHKFMLNIERNVIGKQESGEKKILIGLMSIVENIIRQIKVKPLLKNTTQKIERQIYLPSMCI